MNTNVKIDIHNRFDIEVRDAQTGEIRQNAVAFNIVKVGMWTQLVNWLTYHNNIHFGTGVGTPIEAGSTLFSWLGQKASTTEETIKAMPMSSWKKKIVLNPEEFVGQTITEVGIGHSTSSASIVTHALLQDSEGNPISINKTALDIVTIHATVFVYFATQDAEKIKFVGMPNSNQLVNYLIGGTTFPTSYFYLGENDGAVSDTDRTIETKPVLGTSGSVTTANWIKDVASKKVTTPAMRFGSTVGNGDVMEIGFGSSQTVSSYRSILPITGVFTGQSYTGVTIGVGDGVIKDFVLPSRNVNQNSIIVKVDGVADATITKTLINNAINFAFYDPTTLPTGVGRGCALSSDGLVLAVAHESSPYISTYGWTGSAWVKRANPTTLPTGISRGCALSSDGLILAVAHSTTPFISTYDWIGDAWVKRANPVTLPTSTGFGCALSSDGLILVVAYSTTPFIATYDWTGGVWVKRTNPATLPTGTGYGCALSPNGLILAVAHATTPFISTYDWTGGVWVKRTNPATLPNDTGYGCALSSDGLVLAVVHYATPFISTYDWADSAWVKRTNPATLPTGYGYGYGCALSPNGLILAIAYATTPYVTTYDIKKRQTKIAFGVAPVASAIITADYTVDGIHKTDQYVIDVSFSLQYGEVIP